MKWLFCFQVNSSRSYLDLARQFVSESRRSAVTVGHLQAASSASRRNLAVPARPVATQHQYQQSQKGPQGQQGLNSSSIC